MVAEAAAFLGACSTLFAREILNRKSEQVNQPSEARFSSGLLAPGNVKCLSAP
jgi:hypothetical protein